MNKGELKRKKSKSLKGLLRKNESLKKMVRNALLAKAFIERHKEKEAEKDAHDHIPFMKLSFSDKFFFILDFPFVWIRRVSVPPGEEHNYNNW